MKREVDCLKCGRSWPDKARDPNEHIHKLTGYTLNHFVCDGCGEELPLGVPAICVSVWSDIGGIPYFPWEAEYVTPMSDKELDAYERLDGTKEENAGKRK
jgi:hypothetical protein